MNHYWFAPHTNSRPSIDEYWFRPPPYSTSSARCYKYPPRAYRCERIEREDKGALQSGASCHRSRLRLVATSSICPRLLRWLSCRFLRIRLVETEIRCIFASEIFRESSREVNGSVAQLNRASDYGSEGYRFESCRSHEGFRNQIAEPFFYVSCLELGIF